MNKAKNITDKEFNKLLKEYGAKTMEVFSINQIFKYTKEQKKILKRELNDENIQKHE